MLSSALDHRRSVSHAASPAITAIPGTAHHPLLQFVPVGFGLAAILTLLTSFVTHQDRLVGLAVVFGFLAGVAFLLVPLLAMLAGARAENSSSRR